MSKTNPQFYVISVRPDSPPASLPAGVAWIDLCPFTVREIPDAWPLGTDKITHVIVTSPAAAERMIGAGEILTNAVVLAPGGGTAAALGEQGVANVLFPDIETSEGLMALPELSASVIAGQTVHVFGAPGGRGLIQHELNVRGARVIDVHLYERDVLETRLSDLARWHEIRNSSEGVFLLSSTNALTARLSLLNSDDLEAFLRLKVLASSDRVADAARSAGFDEIVVVNSPDPAQMLSHAPFMQHELR